MAPLQMRFACQTFTWEMLGPAWTGGPDDLVQAIAAGGYSGIEITNTMIGAYGTRPNEFVRRLSDAGLTLVSFAFGTDSGFTEPPQIGADLDAARRWVDFAAHFPGALVSMGSATVMSPGNRADKFAVAAEVYNRAAEIGRLAGVTVAVHPSSHHDTLLFSRADYDAVFSLLDPQVGWVPDTGHILRGGQVMADTLSAFRDRIRSVHLKDVDAEGNWAMLGQGVCDVPTVLATVAKAPNFNGWVVVEEESETAATDPAAAVMANRAFLRTLTQSE
ncbi:MAG: sugar phosphate isomerase/epimerase [Tabrizicola sp.]|uniref:sugar phosphate isomerase/epimerase family protein n=1 Tax=Tabrizicola sp. TaxID=2005166 RepID=UPI002ABA6FBB|nr:sugar phosphate isomerase/epimerase [Tabrizicola sp.]MDZ4087927.1 sugar phosphate isomerase/epimerase [Tabrizicola sp.]